MTGFDTLAAARSLVQSGIPREEAEAIAEQIAKGRDLDLSHLATKADLAELKVWLISAMVGIAGLAIAIAKLL